MTTPRKMLVTSALPYANGHLHLGHMVEHIQTDIWVRVQKMLGHDCVAVCGDDAHGTPIMLKARQQGITPLALTQAMQASHMQDFTAFGIHYDCYHTTHSSENEALVSDIYQRLRERGDIYTKSITQAYDPVENIFLPDRYVKGSCPKCQAVDQYGDSCEVCGATYAPTDLLNPVSAISGATPIEKESEHYFFDLQRYESFLKQWTASGTLQAEVANKLEEWFAAGLQAWDISRDAPYFGFLIPGTQDKYFYVWLDAPIGYMAACQRYCEQTGKSFAEFWAPDTTTELYHFVGKDIMYLRYYFAAKMNGRVDDLDLNFTDLLHRVNADLVGKVVNIASRCAGFIQKNFQQTLAKTMHKPDLYQDLLNLRPDLIAAYMGRDYARAQRLIMEGADAVNQYIDAEKPWVLAKDPETVPQVQMVCSMGLNLFRILMAYLKPVLPKMAETVETFLNCSALDWVNIEQPLLDHVIQPFVPLMQRVEQSQIDALLADTKDMQ
ncbi:MAG: methionine--tRNA ligase [Gammaproteobacteria bacterium]|nr:methionine--tRNA ligase [Gammaproteobacteria bacterium]